MKAAMMDVKKSAQNLSGDANPGEQRPMLMPMELVCGVFWPTLMFMYIFRTNLGWWRHTLAFETFLATMLLPILFNIWYSRRLYGQLRRGICRRWQLVMNVVLWFVILYARLQAEKAYRRYAASYYDFQGMASYINVDSSKDRGQTYMDAGQVYFKEGTKVDVTKAIAFQEDQIYCVAPILQQTLDSGGDKSGASLSGNNLKIPDSGTIDFWAVGMNCCDPSGLNFKCGESTSPLARAGIRVLRDDTRPFFLMAVQEWTAWLRIPAKHPLFFHWVQDPLIQVENFWFKAIQMFYLDTLRCFMGATAGTLILHYIFYNLGV